MIIHNINPIFFSIGPVHVRYYGLVYFLGFLFAYFFFKYLVKKNKIENMNQEKLDSFMVYLIVGSIIGARLLTFVFFSPHILLVDPLEIFRVWNGGMSIHGGLIGAIIAGLIFSKRHKVKFYALADVIIIPLIFVLSIGRLANYINGELWGTITNNNFCVDYSQSQYIVNPPEGCRHPYQLYASLKNFGVALVMFFVNKKNELKPGLLFWYSLLLYNAFRFFVDIFRAEPNVLGPISMGQTLCLIFAGISIYFIIKISKNK